MTTDQPTLAVTQADREMKHVMERVQHVLSVVANYTDAVANGGEFAARHLADLEAMNGDVIADDARILARTNFEPRPAGDLREALADRFWLIVREPGMVPDRKGPWPHRDTAKVMREFIAARPRAFLDVLTIGPDGTPDVQHGPEALQMADARSMSTGSKHNACVRAAAEDALATHSPAPMAGEVVVPAEPTEAMLDAVWHQTGESTEMRSRVHASFRRYWSAMIAAAHPSTQEGGK